MKRFLLICMMAICGGLNMVADEIGVSNVVYIQPEGTTTISINLSNQQPNYVSFQMDLYLPAGFTLNRAGCSLSSRFAYDDQELTIGKQANGAYRLTSTSFTLSPIRGTDGMLLTISITAGTEAVSGTAQIRNIRFATSESERIIIGDTDFYICIMVPKFKVDDVAREYGEENPSFTYTMTDGELEGIPSLTTTATKTSAVGTYEITASRGTIVGHYEATNGTLTITKAPLTATASNYTIIQGEPLPAFAVTCSGFKNNETASVLSQQPVASCEATSMSEPGTYDIIVSGGEATNYDFTYVKGTLTILEQPVTVKAMNITMTYGDAVPSLGYETEGGTLRGVPTLTCSATSASPVGTYPIKVSVGSVSNSNVTYVDGTLTIVAAPLVITSKNYTVFRDESIPQFEAVYSGFKNNEDESVLSQLPTFQCAATSTAESGTYPIYVSGAAAPNYSILYLEGSATIVPTLRGDVNGDNKVSIADVTRLVDIILKK